MDKLTELTDQFHNAFTPNKKEKGWWVLGGYWVVKMQKHDWRLHNGCEENPKFLRIPPRNVRIGSSWVRCDMKKKKIFDQILYTYTILWFDVEKIEEGK